MPNNIKAMPNNNRVLPNNTITIILAGMAPYTSESSDRFQSVENLTQTHVAVKCRCHTTRAQICGAGKIATFQSQIKSFQQSDWLNSFPGECYIPRHIDSPRTPW